MTFDDKGRKLYDAVCKECGEDCKVPFKPVKDMMVRCKECWTKKQLNYGKGSLGKVNGEEFEIKKPLGAVYNILEGNGQTPTHEDFNIEEIISHDDRCIYNEEENNDEDGWF